MNTSLVTVLTNGIVLLVGAIGINLLAQWFHLLTWYDFTTHVMQAGAMQAITSLSIANGIFLFVLYPFALGFIIELLVAKR